MGNNYTIVERMPTVEELFALREAVGWTTGKAEPFVKGLENSLYGVCVIANDAVIGTARVVGDGSTCFYIQDVIVKPECQGMGIGLEIMKKIMMFIKGNACTGAIVGLMSAKNREGFYEKFGFWKRPNEHFGHGMMQFWQEES